MKIETEVRFYFSNKQLPSLARKLTEYYQYSHTYHEVTTMYDNPNPQLTFYSKEVDGRLRLRSSKAITSDIFTSDHKRDVKSECLITWKRRLPSNKGELIRKEEEIEYTTSADDFEAVRSIFENVLQCKRVSSYERIRNFMLTDEVQVTCDQFPFGVMLELELKHKGTEDDILKELEKLTIDINTASDLSCDDMYMELCRRNGVVALPDISFGDETMPLI